MRAQITLKFKNGIGGILPYSHMDDIRKHIYKCLGEINEEFAKEMHDSNLTKFFTFSGLQGGRGKGNIGLDFMNSKTYFYLQMEDNIMELYVNGAYLLKTFYISGYEFELVGINEINYDFKNIYKTITPITVEENPSKRVPNPVEDKFKELLIKNINMKIRNMNISTSDLFKESDIELLSNKSRIFKIKGNSVKSYDLQFKATPELGYYLCRFGAGIKNSMGFGMVTPS